MSKIEPLISVVIPVWNEGKRVERAVRSIMNQTYKNLEIIIVDDHSTDGTWAILERLQKEDSRIALCKLPGKHPRRTNWRGYDINAGYASRAYGFTLAKGNWITTQDADDSSLLNRIEIQYALAKKYNATMLCVEWQQLTPNTEGKNLNIEQLIKDNGEESVLIRPSRLNAIAEENLGLLMRFPLHFLIPFPLKWFPYTRSFFYGKRTPFIGADNCMMFSRNVIERGVNFRHRNYRQWGTPAGRGSGRDFVMQVTYVFKNSWTVRVPLYLWDVRTQHPGVPDYSNYLIS